VVVLWFLAGVLTRLSQQGESQRVLAQLVQEAAQELAEPRF
jgi:hypothetical protein